MVWTVRYTVTFITFTNLNIQLFVRITDRPSLPPELADISSFPTTTSTPYDQTIRLTDPDHSIFSLLYIHLIFITPVAIPSATVWNLSIILCLSRHLPWCETYRDGTPGRPGVRNADAAGRVSNPVRVCNGLKQSSCTTMSNVENGPQTSGARCSLPMASFLVGLIPENFNSTPLTLLGCG